MSSLEEVLIQKKHKETTTGCKLFISSKKRAVYNWRLKQPSSSSHLWSVWEAESLLQHAWLLLDRTHRVPLMFLIMAAKWTLKHTGRSCLRCHIQWMNPLERKKWAMWGNQFNDNSKIHLVNGSPNNLNQRSVRYVTLSQYIGFRIDILLNCYRSWNFFFF